MVSGLKQAGPGDHPVAALHVVPEVIGIVSDVVVVAADHYCEGGSWQAVYYGSMGGMGNHITVRCRTVKDTVAKIEARGANTEADEVVRQVAPAISVSIVCRTPVGAVPVVAVTVVGPVGGAKGAPVPFSMSLPVAFVVTGFIGVAHFAAVLALFLTLLPAFFLLALLLAAFLFLLVVVVLVVVLFLTVFVVAALYMALFALSSSLPVLIEVHCALEPPGNFGQCGGCYQQQARDGDGGSEVSHGCTPERGWLFYVVCGLLCIMAGSLP